MLHGIFLFKSTHRKVLVESAVESNSKKRGARLKVQITLAGLNNGVSELDQKALCKR